MGRCPPFDYDLRLNWIWRDEQVTYGNISSREPELPFLRRQGQEGSLCINSIEICSGKARKSTPYQKKYNSLIFTSMSLSFALTHIELSNFVASYKLVESLACLVNGGKLNSCSCIMTLIHCRHLHHWEMIKPHPS